MWERGQEISNEILNLADPVGNRLAIDKMEIMDNYFDRVLIHIDRANVLMLREMKGYTSATRSYFKQVYVLVIGVIVTGTIISLVTALFLAKSILGPMQMQQSGVRKFGSGSLYHRIGRISSDELGELALVFDDMAGKLQEMAIRDSLTNLFNRREFHRYAAAEMGRSRRYAHPMALLMLDSDHFKTVNDQYGHQIEDEVLKAVAARISSSVRSMEHVSRYGGEEIATILPETGKEDALKAADHLRDTIEKQTFPLANGLEIALTASIGVAVFPEDARTENELVAAADAALYEAKKKGRNCVRAYRITA